MKISQRKNMDCMDSQKLFQNISLSRNNMNLYKKENRNALIFCWRVNKNFGKNLF